MEEYLIQGQTRAQAPAPGTHHRRLTQSAVRASDHGPRCPTIFHEYWWLNTVTRGTFEEVEVSEGGRIVGRLPFYLRRFWGWGFREVRMPCLTHFLGPVVEEGEGSASNRLLRRICITRQLIEKLPHSSSQYVKCHRGVNEVIAFQEQGFRTQVQFTYEIEPLPADTLWANLRNKTRNVIRRAEEQHSLQPMKDPSEFMWFYEQNLSKRGLRNELDRKLCAEIIAASVERGRGRVIAASDSKGRIVAANFCVWDGTSTFYLLSTRTEDSGNGAASLLLWEAIKDSANRGLRFDFAGISSRGSILLFSGFGASISVRYVAARSSFTARLIGEAKRIFRPENHFF